ncbi:MAG: CAP domain-containing protein [bacterium]|nr:CAP domain-containing protein [bacterium]
MLAWRRKKFGFGETLAQLLIPHQRNENHPLLIRHFSLFLATGLVVGTQFLSNLSAGEIRVLGFATNIYQNEVISLTNEQRISNGVRGLKESALLDQAAQKKAADMFAKDYWAHFAPDGTSPWHFFDIVGYKYSAAGENLARDFQTSEGVVQGWMNSPSHKENLLNKNYTEIGVAVVNGSLQGEQTTLVVQLFARSTAVSSSTGSGEVIPKATPQSVSDKVILNNKNSGKVKESTAAAVTKVSGSFSAGVGVLQKLDGLPWAAKAELLLLFSLFSVFLVDSFIIYRKGVRRSGSHSLVHAIVIGILIVSILVTSKGKLI